MHIRSQADPAEPFRSRSKALRASGIPRTFGKDLLPEPTCFREIVILLGESGQVPPGEMPPDAGRHTRKRAARVGTVQDLPPGRLRARAIAHDAAHNGLTEQQFRVARSDQQPVGAGGEGRPRIAQLLVRVRMSSRTGNRMSSRTGNDHDYRCFNWECPGALGRSLLLTHLARWSKCRPLGGRNFGGFLRNVGWEGCWVSVVIPVLRGSGRGFGPGSSRRMRTIRAAIRLRRSSSHRTAAQVGHVCFKFSRGCRFHAKSRCGWPRRSGPGDVPVRAGGRVAPATARRRCPGGRGSRPSRSGEGRRCPRESRRRV